jgi:2-polyprenyl-3-methyl-5-hydroxy-6-metoxy-1,4-benzoquinol methylase
MLTKKNIKTVIPSADNRYQKSFVHLSSPVLEIGCGNGWHSVRMFVDGLTIISLDLSPKSLCQAKACFSHYKVDIPLVKASITNLPFKDTTFNSIVCFEVIEHLPDIKMALSEINRILIDSGMLTMSVPNGYGAFGILNDFILDSLKLVPQVIESKHLQRFTCSLAKYSLNRGGFRIIDWQNLEFLTPLYVITFAAINARINKNRLLDQLIGIDSRMAKRVPREIASDWLLICKKV